MQDNHYSQILLCLINMDPIILFLFWFWQKSDMERTIGVNCHHIHSSDRKLEQADQTFLVEVCRLLSLHWSIDPLILLWLFLCPLATSNSKGYWLQRHFYSTSWPKGLSQFISLMLRTGAHSHVRTYSSTLMMNCLKSSMLAITVKTTSPRSHNPEAIFPWRYFFLKI